MLNILMRSRSALLWCALLGAGSVRAQSLVDLTWDPLLQTVAYGTEVRVDLIAVSQGPGAQPFSAIDALVQWDPGVLLFLGHDDSAADYDWFVAGFFTDPDGINTSSSDGEVLFTALSQAGTPAVASVALAGGLNVTSLRFVTLAPTAGTLVSLAPASGTFGETRVIDYFVPGLEITGDIGTTATIAVGGKTHSYCTAKVNSLGCVPQIGFSGTPSVSDPNPFTVQATMVLNARNGLFFYGYTGPANIPFFGGTLCVQPPLRRTSVQNSGGTLPPTMDCSGQYTFDFNALIQSNLDPFLVPGQQINAQYWSRDPLHVDGTGVGLTDGIEFVIVD